MVALNMPLFVAQDDVILRMQLQSGLSGIQQVVGAAIMAAELIVERLLEGKLKRQSLTSDYYLDKQSFSGIQPDGIFKVEIPSGLIRQDTPVLVSFDSRWNFPGPQSADPTLLAVDYNRGYVLLDAETYGCKYIRISCDTGFEDGTTPYPVTGVAAYDNVQAYAIGDLVVENNIVYQCIAVSTGNAPPNPAFWVRMFVPMEQIPNEVYEAILALVPSVFDITQNTNRSQEAAPQYQKATDHALLILGPYLRMRGFSFRPIRTV